MIRKKIYEIFNLLSFHSSVFSEYFSILMCNHNIKSTRNDIVGFTEMSSNKSAGQLVFLLNDLYNRFDEYCKVTNCEKIGTLGDCYYCVSGCPVARLDHAVCCIEMGLGMCKIIQKFNIDHIEKVNMRVGVHSGKVIAAIIGNYRFRFDVFSNDVIIANALETSGIPGLVHISDETYLLVRHAYLFKNGENLDVKKEEIYGLSGMLQKSCSIKTYFVLPSNYVLKHKTHDLSLNNKLNNIPFQNYSNSMTGNLFNGIIKINKKFRKKDVKIQKDLNLIRTLESDPAKPVEFFQNPPINPFFLTFKNKEIEAHYLFHGMDQIKKIQIDSIKIAPLLDAIACLIYSSVIFLAAFIMIPKRRDLNKLLPWIYLSGIFVTFIVAWTSLIYKSEMKLKFFKVIFHIVNHPIARLIFSIYMSCLPSMLVLSLYRSDHVYESQQDISTYFTLTLFALMGNCIFTSSYSSVKHISTIIFTILGVQFLVYITHNCVWENDQIETCAKLLIDKLNIRRERREINFFFQMINICLLIYYLTRENEKNTRIQFYASREADIKNDEAKREKRIAEDLLYNIIPKYVFAQIMSNKSKNHKNLRFSYAHAIPTAGVLFACISNFFNSYYREDYKGGEVALKLLHTIICTFDNLLQKSIYKQIEKIKTINDCYMVASGLNTNLESRHGERHLRTLMNLAFDMETNLYHFNKQYIVGDESFKLKIGYNFGPVTAGIIGNTRPLYDIWGDTVNVASRMYTTAPSGYIQAPDYVENKLNKYFEFKLRGNVSIKGKGEMLTYLVLKSYENIHLHE